MITWIAGWVVHAFAIYIVARILPGIYLADFQSALIAALVIGLVNTLFKPIFVILTLPITILTLGLFSLVVNAVLLMLASALTPGFKVDSFWTALIGSILLSIINMLLGAFTKR